MRGSFLLVAHLTGIPSQVNTRQNAIEFWGVDMGRTLALLLLSAGSAFAQVAPQQDSGLTDQLVPESFKFEASASAQQINWFWNTTINYSLKNNSGMNLYLGLMTGSVAFGSCTDVQEARGALMMLPAADAHVWSQQPGRPPRGILVGAGARISGAIVLANCGAPNPGYPTAPLSATLMIGKSDAFRSMTASFPLSIDAPIRQLQAQ